MAKKRTLGPVTIKKYGNRRLYDTDESRYVTLEELEEKVRSGTDVQVIDARTGGDLTQATLTQIIIEGRGAGRLLPIPLLTQLIRLGDEALAEFVGRWMSAALDVYLQARSRARVVSTYNPFASMPFDLTGALARMMMGGGLPQGTWGEGEPQGRPAPPEAPPEHDVRSEMDALRDEIATLRESLRQPAEAPRRPAPRRRSKSS